MSVTWNLFIFLFLTAAYALPSTVKPGTPDLDCKDGVNGSRWRVECNWCTCSETGISLCTRRGCPPGFDRTQEKECEGTPEWRVDCNWCTCAEGQAECSSNPCDGSQSVSARAEGVDCIARSEGAQFKDKCNWCRCSDKGEAICTKKRCPPAHLVRDSGPPPCVGEIEWKDDCNWCDCVNGVGSCTENLCLTEDTQEPFTSETKATILARSSPGNTCELRSAEGSWAVDCNTCICANGHAVCTRKACHPADVRTSSSCEGDVRWRVDCNWCQCVDGTGVCSEDTCSRASATEVETRNDCGGGEGSYRRAGTCNWCNCHSGLGGCTKIGCRANDPKMEPAECSGEATWRDGCNWCKCVDNMPVCTNNECPPESQQAEANNACTEGLRWVEGCNNCICHDGAVYCTKDSCTGVSETNTIDTSVLKRHGEEIGAVLRDPGQEHFSCKDGSRWNPDGCNWCSCFGNKAACTLKQCYFSDGKGGQARREQEPVCEGGALWSDNCNICSCEGNVPVCSTKDCSQEPSLRQEPIPEDRECISSSESARWRQSCNWCTCTPTGLGICTRKGCPPELELRLRDEKACEGDVQWRKGDEWCTCANDTESCEPLRSAPKATAAVAGVATLRRAQVPEIETSESGTAEEPMCTQGSRWMALCNWCSCSNGHGLCTLKGCVSDAALELDGTCKGDSRWRNDCNWCDCVDGRGSCTTKDCTPVTEVPATEDPNQAAQDDVIARQDQEPECEEGSRWGKGCNWCSCAKRLAVCTLKACLPGSENAIEGQCKSNSKWRQDCNWCKCVDEKAVCTEKACIDDVIPEPAPRTTCVSGSSWIQDCNHCFCSNGLEVCTRRLCIQQQPLAARSEDCAENDALEDDCNQCICLNGKRACTKMLCFEPQGRSNVCNLPAIDPNADTCGGFQMMWTFNAETGICEEIVYGGCGGTENLFATVEDCNIACGTREPTVQKKSAQNPKEICSLPVEAGHCFARIRKFAFVAERNRCELFYYGGCGGNDNNFETADECYNTCGGGAPVIDSECDRSSCDWKRYTYYLTKSCQPVYEGGACCPTRFVCKTKAELGFLPDICYYRGKEYPVGDPVPVDSDCSKGCLCRKLGETVEISCASVECRSLFRQQEPGCRYLYELGKCCSVGQECSPETTESPTELEQNSIECAWNNGTWKVGDRMYFDDEPCRLCICTEDFTGPEGPACEQISCGYDFNYQRSLFQGCTPVFFEEKCCPIDWICPDEPVDVTGVTQPEQGSTRAVRAGECTMGETVVPVGGTASLADCHIKCSCRTPPELTCVRHRTCEAAEESVQVDTTDCPAPPECPPDCIPAQDDVTGCPTCFCNGMEFICPEPSCPPACVNPQIEFDESKGCNVCKCECRKDVRGHPHCPLDCVTKIIFDEETGCNKCVCDRGNPASIHT